MLEVTRVSKRYKGGNWGVRDLSLRVDHGVLGLLGPNGAGKTTLMQMLATVTRPTSGNIRFDGVDLVADPDAVRARLGYLPQDFGVYDNLTAREFLGYFAALKGVRDRARIEAMLEAVNLHAVGDRTVDGFSGGMRQRLGIAQALVNDPDLVIVDEPTAGLDPEERVRFRNVLSEAGFGKRLVVLSTHIVSDIESIATVIAVVRGGAIAAVATPEELLRGAVGSVWQVVVSSATFDAQRGSWTISSAVRRPDGIHARVIAPVAPLSDAVAVEPTLEDAYLHVMTSAASAGVAA